MSTTMTVFGRNQALTALGLMGTCYVSLHTAAPAAGSASEVTDANYRRQATTFALDSSAGQASTTAALTWPAAAGAFTVTHVGIYDALTGGNLVAFLSLASSQAIAAAGVFAIPAGEFTVGGA